MTVQTLKLGRERFVVLKEKDYRQLKAQAARTQPATPKSRRATGQDRADLAEGKRRLADRSEKPIPWARAKKDLGLA